MSTLLSSPVGTMEEFRFDQEVPRDTFADVICVEPLVMHIKVVRQEYGLQSLLMEVHSTIDIPSESIEDKYIEIINVSREFHLKKKPDDSDDIEYIDDHDATIDLTNIISQELIIAGW